MKSLLKNNIKNKNKLRKCSWKSIVLVISVVFVVIIACVFPAVAETFDIINDTDSADLTDGVIASAEQVGEDDQAETKNYARVLVVHDGVSDLVESEKETVGQLLSDLNIKLGENRRISSDLSDEIEDGMMITVSTLSYYERNEIEEADYNIMYVFDPSMDEDEEFVIIPGISGTKNVKYEVTLVDGKEESRSVLDETILEAPVDALVSTGDRNEATLGDPTEEGMLVATNGSTYEYSKIVPMIATAYTHSGNLTATEVPPRFGIVAADTKVLPFGTLVYITARDGSWTYGYAVVGDTGVKGHILDLFMDSYDDCIQFGARKANVYVIER